MNFGKVLKRLAKRTILGPIIASAGNSSRNRFFLTFDDGPDPEGTPPLLDLLDKHNAKASFFWLGENMERYPWLCRESVARGHMGCNHSFSHARLKGLPFRRVRSEIESTDALLRQTSRASNFLIRPPYGEIGLGLILYAYRYKRKLVLWTLDPEDFQAASEKEIRAFFGRNPIGAGDIILLHEDARHTAAALDAVLSAALAKGLSAATLDEAWHDDSRVYGVSSGSRAA